MSHRLEQGGRRAIGLALALWLALPSVAAADAFGGQFLIGTGGFGGVYYPLGSAICRLYNRDYEDENCLAVQSQGSVANIRALIADVQDFGIVQSDIERDAVRGEGPFAGAPIDADLRVLFVAHAEAFTILAGPGTGIRGLDDLPGRRIAAGSEGSGSLVTTRELMHAAGWDDQTFAAFVTLSPEDQVAALCDGGVDATILQLGHPNGYVQNATLHCGAHLAPVTGAAVDALTGDSFLRPVFIPGGLYAGQAEATETFGVLAEVVARADQPDERISRLLSAVFDNLETLKRLHPAFAGLNREMMVPRQSAATLHPAAEAFYRERGWLPEAP